MEFVLYVLLTWIVDVEFVLYVLLTWIVDVEFKDNKLFIGNTCLYFQDISCLYFQDKHLQTI